MGGWEVTPPYTWAVCSKWVMQMSDTHQYGVQTRLFGELSSDLGWIKRIKHFLLLIKKFVDHTKLFRVGDPMNGPQGSSTARTNTCLFLGGAVVLEAPPLLSIYHHRMGM